MNSQTREIAGQLETWNQNEEKKERSEASQASITLDSKELIDKQSTNGSKQFLSGTSLASHEKNPKREWFTPPQFLCDLNLKFAALTIEHISGLGCCSSLIYDRRLRITPTNFLSPSSTASGEGRGLDRILEFDISMQSKEERNEQMEEPWKLIVKTQSTSDLSKTADHFHWKWAMFERLRSRLAESMNVKHLFSGSVCSTVCIPTLLNSESNWWVAAYAVHWSVDINCEPLGAPSISIILYNADASELQMYWSLILNWKGRG